MWNNTLSSWVFPTMKSIGGVKDENGVSSKPSEEVKTESEKIDFSKVKIEPLFEEMVDFDTNNQKDFGELQCGRSDKCQKREKATCHYSKLFLPPPAAYFLHEVLRKGNKCKSHSGCHGTR